MPGNSDLRPVADAVLRDIERFLFWEARLLDGRRFHEWVDLFTEDVHYWMPVRGDSPAKTLEAEFAKESELAFFDETKETLLRRVLKLETGMAWAEEPPSRTRHILTNVEAYKNGSNSEILVYSNFLVYRTRLETKEDLFIGRREDSLRKDSKSWKIAQRKVFIDQSVLFADNLSIFF